MIAHFGYQDASGDYFIAIDTDACTGCGACVTACPAALLQVIANPYDPLDDRPIAVVRPGEERLARVRCAACKASSAAGPLPCLTACDVHAIGHSW